MIKLEFHGRLTPALNSSRFAAKFFEFNPLSLPYFSSWAINPKNKTTLLQKKGGMARVCANLLECTRSCVSLRQTARIYANLCEIMRMYAFLLEFTWVYAKLRESNLRKFTPICANLCQASLRKSAPILASLRESARVYANLPKFTRLYKGRVARICFSLIRLWRGRTKHWCPTVSKIWPKKGGYNSEIIAGNDVDLFFPFQRWVLHKTLFQLIGY